MKWGGPMEARRPQFRTFQPGRYLTTHLKLPKQRPKLKPAATARTPNILSIIFSGLRFSRAAGLDLIPRTVGWKAYQNSHMARSPSPRRRSPSPFPDQAAITARLKVLARYAKVSRIPFDNDRSEHHKAFSRAISNVLSTELALFTFAQIIDGLPTADVAWDRRYSHLVGIHPIEQHEDICPGVLARARRFREDFDPCILSFDPQVRPPPPLADHVIYATRLDRHFAPFGKPPPAPAHSTYG
jgi:hypothetical protein